MDSQAFAFNREAAYKPGEVYSVKVTSKQLTQPGIQVANKSPQMTFQAQFPDVFQKYRLPHVHSEKLVQAWHTNPMQFWQNQVNFAVWCATTGCGVSARDHLSDGSTNGSSMDPLMKALYVFHVYYQVRRILDELQAPLPQDQAWTAYNNPYNRRAYERVCNEFGISPHTDWRIHGANDGLGNVFVYWYTIHKYRILDLPYDPKTMSFTKQTTNEVVHISHIAQDPEADSAWATFILEKSQGFTQAGTERLNDSIRTYVWAVLGAQAQTRTRIMGTGTAFDAQKQFLANVEDAISSPVDLPSAIKRYQEVLQYAGSKVDFVFGVGLYMAPSDMLLHIGQVAGYNNEIMVATHAQTLGMNTDVNTMPTPPAADTSETGLVKPQDHSLRASASTVRTPGTPRTDPLVLPVLVAKQQTKASAPAISQSGVSGGLALHNEEKTALVIGMAGVGLLALWAFRP